MTFIHPPHVLDETDRRIIKETQAGLPIERDPYGAVARNLGLERDDVMRRLAAMKDAGIVRRVGAVPNHYKLGITANGMSVWDVPDELIGELGPQVGALDFVSHCYHRPRHLPTWPYSLFAMVHGRTRDECADHVATIADLLGPADRGHDILYSTRILKKTGLRLVG